MSKACPSPSSASSEPAVARQFDVWRTSRGTLVTVIQNDLLDDMQTRVVAPLVPIGVVGRRIRNLNPVVSFGERTMS